MRSLLVVIAVTAPFLLVAAYVPAEGTCAPELPGSTETLKTLPAYPDEPVIYYTDTRVKRV